MVLQQVQMCLCRRLQYILTRQFLVGTDVSYPLETSFGFDQLWFYPYDLTWNLDRNSFAILNAILGLTLVLDEGANDMAYNPIYPRYLQSRSNENTFMCPMSY